MEDVNCFVYGGERVYNVMDVARYITNYSIEIGRPVSNLKWQKLLYFIQVAFIKQYEITRYEEPIVHWRHGPVVESVYQKYKAYGAENITDKEREYFSFHFNVDTRSFVMEPKNHKEDIFEHCHQMLINSIVKNIKMCLHGIWLSWLIRKNLGKNGPKWRDYSESDETVLFVYGDWKLKEWLQKIGMTEIHNILQLDSLCEIIKEYYIIIKDISIQKFQYGTFHKLWC